MIKNTMSLSLKMNRALRLISSNSMICKKGLYTSSNLQAIYEYNRSGYKPVYDNPKKPTKGLFNKLLEGCRQIRDEITLYVQEWKDTIRNSPEIVIPGKEAIVWKFSESNNWRDKWIVTCDSDYEEGFSTASLEMSPHGTAVFSGVLNATLPKDGRILRAGYCNITTAPLRMSFRRTKKMDWSAYNYLVLRVRGDGRGYMLNLLMKGFFDASWYDSYHYVLYTRGGPYWQEVKIPFSRFFYGNKAYIQDSQSSACLDEISNFGITISDNVTGPFRLEIDYIGVMYCGYHFEDTAYETYQVEDIKF